MKNIKNKLDNKEWLVFKIDTLKTFNILEDTLLSIGYTWLSYNDNRKCTDINFNFNDDINVLIHINFKLIDNYYPLKIAYSINRDEYPVDYSLMENNINFFINQILLPKPCYKPKKNNRII